MHPYRARPFQKQLDIFWNILKVLRYLKEILKYCKKKKLLNIHSFFGLALRFICYFLETILNSMPETILHSKNVSHITECVNMEVPNFSFLSPTTARKSILYLDRSDSKSVYFNDKTKRYLEVFFEILRNFLWYI